MEGPPQLKLEDPQILSAFSSGDWSLAARLAGARFRTTKDQIYQIVKICAESQLDDPIAKFGALSSVWNYVDEKAVVGVDGIDLLEWATRELADEGDYAETLGALRVRAVKAAPEKDTAVSCLKSCLLHWDLVSAQQIATILDKTYPEERKFMFWAIATTHLLATSSQVPEGKAKLYGTLALRQIEIAAKLSENNTDATSRSVQTEEETILLYAIVAKHGSQTDLGKLLSSSIFSPLQQLRRASKDAVKYLAALYTERGDWDALFKLFKDCSSVDQAVCSWDAWRPLINATRSGPYARDVHDLLLRFSSEEGCVCDRTIQLAEVAAAFFEANGRRIQSLQRFIEIQGDDVACFADIREFVEMLEPAEKTRLATSVVPKIAASQGSATIKLLDLKLKYMLSSRPTASKTCVVCGGHRGRGCKACLSMISQAAVELRQSLIDPPLTQEDIVSELSVLVAYCRIKPCNLKSRDPETVRQLLLALVELESQRARDSKHSQLSLLLCQLHTLLGSAHRAREIIHAVDDDSFAPLFLDRLSTIAPGIISSGIDIMDELKMRDISAKRQLVDALYSGSHSDLLTLHSKIEGSTSKTLSVVTLIEEARAKRLSGSQLSVLQDTRHVSDDVSLATVETVLPWWESSTSENVLSRLQIGQPPSNERLHLSLLSEVFCEVLTSPSKHADATEADAFVLGKMSQICNAAHRLIPNVSCTVKEMAHYQVIGLLSGLIPLGASLIASPAHKADFAALAGAVQVALENMRKSLPPNGGDFISDVTVLASLHGVSMHVDSAGSVRLAAKWLTDLNDRERERSGKTIDSSEMQLLNELESRAETVLNEARELMALNSLKQREFEDKLKRWILGEQQASSADAVISDLVLSWRANSKDWSMMQLS